VSDLILYVWNKTLKNARSHQARQEALQAKYDEQLRRRLLEEKIQENKKLAEMKEKDIVARKQRLQVLKLEKANISSNLKCIIVSSSVSILWQANSSNIKI